MDKEDLEDEKILVSKISAINIHNESFDDPHIEAQTCKMPQASETDYRKDDVDSGSGSDVDTDSINIVDLSTSTNVSYFEPSLLNISILSSDQSTNLQNMSTKRPLNGPEKLAKRHRRCALKRSLMDTQPDDTSSDDETNPVHRSVTTRSGRTVRLLMDNKFDYSAEQIEDDDDDNEDVDDQDYNQFQQNEPKWVYRKQRCLSSGTSQSSSDSISQLEVYMHVYLDLSDSTATVKTCLNIDDTDADKDPKLKTNLQKFLGLIPSKRRLYNPLHNYEPDDQEENTRLPNKKNMDGKPVFDVPPLTTPMSQTSTPLVKRSLNSSLPTMQELGMKLIDDVVQRTNKNYIDSNTPAHIKAPIDLSGLPSVEQRTFNCRLHKRVSEFLDYPTRFYSFLDSLNDEIPIGLCHPQALTFRSRRFETYKKPLAKIIFNMLNHKVFYCGLEQRILWKENMQHYSSCDNRIDQNGVRTSTIILWEDIPCESLMIMMLMHEMCHAAAFVYHGETGHGDFCRKWVYQAKMLLPELPILHKCTPIYKYTCCLCHKHAYGNMKFEDDSQQLRCHFCQFEVVVDHYDPEDVHNVSFTHLKPTDYKAFIKSHYTDAEGMTHVIKMKTLNDLYLARKPINQKSI